MLEKSPSVVEVFYLLKSFLLLQNIPTSELVLPLSPDGALRR
jgi:hypothetical protein